MPISLKNMRGAGCASHASTAICTATVSSATLPRRLNSYLSSTNPAPCISDHLPFSPRKKHSSSSSSSFAPRRISSAEVSDYLRRRRSSADVKDLDPPRSSSSRYRLLRETSSFRFDDRKSVPSEVYPRDTNPLALVLSEPVLEDEPVLAMGSTKSRRDDSVRLSAARRRDSDTSTALVASQKMVKSERHGSNYSPGARNGRSGLNHLAIVKSSSQPPPPSTHQVVVLRVSLHCKGCENKLRKHLSKMQGVTSYSIELDTRKVTVIGSVTPLDVLNSISKVKNAQFWPSPAKSTSSASPSSLSGSSKSEFSY